MKFFFFLLSSFTFNSFCSAHHSIYSPYSLYLTGQIISFVLIAVGGDTLGMCGNCKLISALLISIVGLVFLLVGLGMMTNVLQANLIVGVLLLIFGLAGIAHALKLCPCCKDDCCQMAEKKSK